MKITRIHIANFANIGDVNIDLADITALVAPNNYGKTNVLEALRFGIDFISAPPKAKESAMALKAFIPINSATQGKPFEFEICGLLNDNAIQFKYYYSFRWGDSIISEQLSIKDRESKRYTIFLSRDKESEATYIPSAESRCIKSLEVAPSILALNKLTNFDDLFFVDLLRKIEGTDIKVVDTLKSPDSYFIMSNGPTNASEYSTAFPTTESSSYFIYSLKMLEPDAYDMLCDATKQLLPNIEDIEAVEVNIGHGDNATDRLYDIRIKEYPNTSYTSINRVSSGSKKILYLLALTIAAALNNIPLITFEELENSVHPRLLQNLLIIMCSFAGNTKILTTSHSPYLIRYLNPEQIYLGLPTDKGIAEFRKLKPTKVKSLMRRASSEEISLGEYLFEMMLDMQTDSSLVTQLFI